MLNLKLASILEKNKLSSNQPWLLLLKIRPDPDNAPDTAWFFVRNNEDVFWNSDQYTAFNFGIGLNKATSKGELPTLDLTVSNINGIVQSELKPFNGGCDAEVTIMVVAANVLPAGDPDLVSTFTVSQSTFTADTCTFTLGSDNPMKQLFPLSTFLANHCWKTYSSPTLQGRLDVRAAPCGYEGSLPTCTRLLDGDNGCRAHDNVINFGGFPGIATGGFRRATP